MTALLMGGIILGLVTVQLCLTFGCTSAGQQLDELEEKTVELEQELVLIKQEVGRLGSLASIQTRAMAGGFTKTDQVVYLPANIPVALGY